MLDEGLAEVKRTLGLAGRRANLRLEPRSAAPLNAGLTAGMVLSMAIDTRRSALAIAASSGSAIDLQTRLRPAAAK